MVPITTVPPPADPGLSARIDVVDRQLAGLVADLDPDRVLGSEAAALYGAFARLERLVVAAKTLLARGSRPPVTGSPRAIATPPACSRPWKASRPDRHGAPWRPASGWSRCLRPRRRCGPARCRAPR